MALRVKKNPEASTVLLKLAAALPVPSKYRIRNVTADKMKCFTATTSNSFLPSDLIYGVFPLMKNPEHSLASADDVATDGLAGESKGDVKSNVPLSPHMSLIAVDTVRPRATDTRAVAAKHIDKLCASISEIGLIHPIVVDQTGLLLAGGHRLAAIYRLRDENMEAFNRWFKDAMVPVRVMPFDAGLDTRRALEVEVSENEKRRDYTDKDLQELVARFKEAGFSTRLGGPSGGKRHITGALAAVIGKSERTVRRMLQTRHKPDVEGDGADKAARAMIRAMHRFLKVAQEQPSSNSKIKALKRWVASGPAGRGDKQAEEAAETEKATSKVA